MSEVIKSYDVHLYKIALYNKCTVFFNENIGNETERKASNPNRMAKVIGLLIQKNQNPYVLLKKQRK